MRKFIYAHSHNFAKNTRNQFIFIRLSTLQAFFTKYFSMLKSSFHAQSENCKNSFSKVWKNEQFSAMQFFPSNQFIERNTYFHESFAAEKFSNFHIVFSPFFRKNSVKSMYAIFTIEIFFKWEFSRFSTMLVFLHCCC